jgi:hypothetical protein
MPDSRHKNPRTRDLEIALSRGECSKSNHAIEADDEKVRCFHFGTCVLELDRDDMLITDHGTYGWSVSTSKAIGQYLDALVEKRLITRKSMLTANRRIFKNGKGRYDAAASWYPVKTPKSRKAS